MSFFDAVYQGEQMAKDVADLRGRSYGVQLGVVADTEDPEGLGRVKCLLASKAGRSSTDWLYRVQGGPFISLPIPLVGQTVAVLFVDGNPHSGVYMGPIHNLLNPHGAVDTLMVQVGSAQILMAPDGAIAVIGTDINIQADNVAINGKQVATVGAPDTRGDNLTARGW